MLPAARVSREFACPLATSSLEHVRFAPIWSTYISVKGRPVGRSLLLQCSAFSCGACLQWTSFTTTTAASAPFLRTSARVEHAGRVLRARVGWSARGVRVGERLSGLGRASCYAPHRARVTWYRERCVLCALCHQGLHVESLGRANAALPHRHVVSLSGSTEQPCCHATRLVARRAYSFNSPTHICSGSLRCRLLPSTTLWLTRHALQHRRRALSRRAEPC